MHRPVCITYDSTCDLTPQLLERFRIRTVPLTIQSGERVFPDDGRYTSADLYADYRSRGTLPKTAAVSPEEFKSFFAPILAEGYDIVHIDISAELSCTCQNAVLAAQELTERGEIHVVDSRQLSAGGGLLALQGAKLRDSGMAAADIAVSSSRSEGLPFNIMEAMACGLPSVASAVKGHTDLIGPENGLLYPYGDAKAFAAAVERLVSDAALRAELGQAGREKMQRYALDAVLPQVMDRYLSVMEGKTR